MTALAAPVPPFNETTLRTLISARQEPSWIADRRRQAFEIYEAKLTEALDPEEYRRVDLRAFRPEKYRWIPEPSAEVQFDTLMAQRAEFAGNVAHVDGHCVQSRLSADYAAQGVLFGDLSVLLPQHRDVLEPHFLSHAVRATADRFAAWHAAFWTGGTVLYVPRNVELQQPLHSLIGLSRDGAADLSHTLVILEEGAKATLLEETISATATAGGAHIGAVELILQPGSQLQYVQLQNWNEKVWHIAHQAGRVERDATVQWTVGGLGGKLAHIHQHVHLDGRGAHAEVNGVTFATDRQVLSYYTQQTHHAPDTRSDLLYKDVLRDKSRVIWRGMIKVDKDAQKTDGYQRNDALMMSDDARADLIPGLEIQADDVRCTHGATAGRVDEEQLFYCMCRGLSRSEAMHMIVEGFFQRVYDRIPVELVRETLSQAVQKKLGLGD